nr:hypothetical protein HmN_000980700 [Hymenolepis microstoma]
MVGECGSTLRPFSILIFVLKSLEELLINRFKENFYSVVKMEVKCSNVLNCESKHMVQNFIVRCELLNAHNAAIPGILYSPPPKAIQNGIS